MSNQRSTQRMVSRCHLFHPSRKSFCLENRGPLTNAGGVVVTAHRDVDRRPHGGAGSQGL